MLICGTGNIWGDVITPIVSAHLVGAKNLIIAGVNHSPQTSGIWYGSPGVRDEWTVHLI